MPNQEPSKAPDVHKKESSLPVPAQGSHPVAAGDSGASTSAGAVARPETLAQALASGPLAAASLAGAAAAAAATGAALAARLLWPWAGAGWRELPRSNEEPRSGEEQQSLSGWAGPGVHVSYTRTHLEIHWPLPR